MKSDFIKVRSNSHLGGYANKKLVKYALRRQECPNFAKGETSRNRRLSGSTSLRSFHPNPFGTSLNPDTLSEIAGDGDKKKGIK